MKSSPTQQLTDYLRDSWLEIKKITWPSKKDVQRHTVLVIIISLATAAFLGACDYILAGGLEQLINLIKG
ncbi:MAG: preprotein translocase subunit SecE [Patescibacteria group bacterium]